MVGGVSGEGLEGRGKGRMVGAGMVGGLVGRGWRGGRREGEDGTIYATIIWPKTILTLLG